MNVEAETEKELDILEMPLKGMASYWLSLKKVLGNKFNAKAVDEEAERTNEPFVKHMLGLCSSSFGDETVRRLALAKQDILLSEARLKFDLMRVALVAVAANDNPRKALVDMISRFAVPPVSEAKAVKMANDMADMVQSGPMADKAVFSVDHKMKPEQLLVKLLFFIVWARREGKMALSPFSKLSHTPLFAHALALVADGFEGGFVDRRMKAQVRELLDSARLKMDMTTEMVLAIRQKTTYEDISKIAASYML